MPPLLVVVDTASMAVFCQQITLLNLMSTWYCLWIQLVLTRVQSILHAVGFMDVLSNYKWRSPWSFLL